MEKFVRRIRKQLEAARQRSAGRTQYPSELKAEVVVAAAALQDAGSSRQAASRELGLNPVTLSEWQRKAASEDDGPDASMLPVAVITEREVLHNAQHPVVHGPLGVRVEGLDVEGVADLLRRLA